MGVYKRRECNVLLCELLYLVLVFCVLFHEIGGIATDNPNQQVISRKLIPSSGEKVGKRTARIGLDTCSKDDVVVYQGATAPLPNGIPTYTVQIINMCMSGCVVSNIHLSCGWFSSARLVNPTVFRRVSYDDCLVNDGGPISPGQSVSFVYANTYQYQLNVASVVCT